MGAAAQERALARSHPRPVVLPLGLLALVPLAVPLAPALAQGGPGSGDLALPTVTATGAAGDPRGPVAGYAAARTGAGAKTATPVEEVPQAVSVVTRDQLDDRAVQSVAEAIRFVPGVRTETFGADPRYDWFSLRGFDAQANSVYRDGLRYNFGNLTGMLEPWGMERIEVVRGPASVLYGQAAPGGVVDMVTRRPRFGAPHGEIQVTGGSFERAQTAFDAGVTAADGRVALRLTGLLRSSGTQVDRVRNDRVYLAPALSWRPTDATTVTLLPYYQADHAQGAEFLPRVGTVVPSRSGRIPTSRYTGEPGEHHDRTQYGIGYLVEHRLNQAWTLRHNARYAHVGTRWDQTYGAGLNADGRTLGRFGYDRTASADSFQADTQAEVRFATGPAGHTVLGGVDYFGGTWRPRASFAVATGLDLYAPAYGAPQPARSPFQDQRQVSRQVGVYLQDQVRLGERLTVTVGGRHDWASTDTDNRLGTATTTKQDDAAFTWRAGATYRLGAGLTPYVGYTRSFLPTLGTSVAGATFRPTEGEQVEAGLRFQPANLPATLSAAVFDLRQRNALTTDPANPLNQVQTGEVQVRGLELEAVAGLGRGFSLVAAYTRLETEVTRTTVAAERGRRFNGIPDSTASAWLDYTFREGRTLAGLGLGAGVRHVGSSPAGNANLFYVPDFTLVDAALRYDLGQLAPTLRGFRVALNASNIADQRFVSTCGGEATCFYGLRRSVIGTLAYRW